MVPHSFPPAALFHLAYFGLILPYRTWRGRHWPTGVNAPARSRLDHYRSNLKHFAGCGVISTITVLILSLRAGTWDAWLAFFPLEWPSLSSLVLGVIAFAVLVSIDLEYSRRCFDRGAPHMYAATPQTRQERAAWIVQSMAAGVTEELTWRGVQPMLIAHLTGMWWPGIIICAATFGIGHITQGRPFVLIAAGFALVFHALTWLTGSLYVPISVHIAVNVVVGLRAGQWKHQVTSPA